MSLDNNIPWIVQGDDVNIVVTTDIAITGANDIKFVIQRNRRAAFQKTLASSQITIDNANQFTIELLKADSIGLAPGIYKWQAVLTDSESKEKAIQFRAVINSVEVAQDEGFEILERLNIA